MASDTEPVPAGGSVAALTGAAGAALVVLVCRVIAHRRPEDVAATLALAERLQARLAALVDADAAAYQAFLAARGTSAEAAERERAATSPLEIARACAEVVPLAEAALAVARGAIASDAEVAVTLARAAQAAALTTAAHNLPLVRDPVLRAELARAIADLK